MKGDRQRIRFPSEGLVLEGVLTRPAGVEPSGTAVFCHPHPGYGGDMNNNAVIAACSGFASASLAALRFNFRGVGASQGRSTGGQAEVADALAALEAAGAESPGRGLAVLGGYSFGAWVALQAASTAEGLSALVLVSPPAALYDFSAIGKPDIPALVLSGDADAFCGPDALRDLAAEFGAGARVEILPGVDHFWMGGESRLTDLIASFCREISSERATRDST